MATRFDRKRGGNVDDLHRLEREREREKTLSSRVETRFDGISSAKFRSGQRRVSGRDIMINGNSLVYDLISIHPGPAPLIIGHYESFNNAIRARGGGGGGGRVVEPSRFITFIALFTGLYLRL